MNIEPRNVLIKKFICQICYSPDFGTNLGPKCVDLIFNAPNVANLGFRKI